MAFWRGFARHGRSPPQGGRSASRAAGRRLVPVVSVVVPMMVMVPVMDVVMPVMPVVPVVRIADYVTGIIVVIVARAVIAAAIIVERAAIERAPVIRPAIEWIAAERSKTETEEAMRICRRDRCRRGRHCDHRSIYELSHGATSS